MAKTVHRYTIRAEIAGEIEYDATDPASYTKALEAVAAKRNAVKDAGARITHDVGKPVTVKGA